MQLCHKEIDSLCHTCSNTQVWFTVYTLIVCTEQNLFTIYSIEKTNTIVLIIQYICI